MKPADRLNMVRSTPFGNAFLDSLGEETLRRLQPHLTHKAMKIRTVLSAAGETVEALFFPTDCVISTLTEMSDGGAVEVGLAGAEGWSGLSLLFGPAKGTHLVIVQIAGSAYRLPAAVFVDTLNVDAGLRERALSYAGYAFTAATQFAACNRLHPTQERYARWLLMASDRVGSNTFNLTQEFSAQMLGVRRAGINVIAGALAGAGLITYVRGRVVILDRAALEATACECYRTVNNELRTRLGYDARRQ